VPNSEGASEHHHIGLEKFREVATVRDARFLSFEIPRRKIGTSAVAAPF
jgi:hypothetical protein